MVSIVTFFFSRWVSIITLDCPKIEFKSARAAHIYKTFQINAQMTFKKETMLTKNHC